MKATTLITAFLTITIIGSGSLTAADNPTAKATVVGGLQMSTSAPLNVITGLASMPLAFTENQGQWDDQVLFRANAGSATMWFTRDGAYYQFTRRIPGHSSESGNPVGVGQYPHASDRFDHEPVQPVPHSSAVGSYDPVSRHHSEPDNIETMMIKANVVGSNPRATVRGVGLMEYKCNYFIGNDPSKWRPDVPNYRAVVYKDIYPGIDLKYYGNGKQMEYDFIVSPGADPSQIQVRYEGVKGISVNDAGELVVKTEWGTVTELKPFVYQLDGSERTLVKGEYTLASDNTFGFNLKDGYNPKLALVIDPILSYSTYLGGISNDYGNAITVDATGAAYVTGSTKSADFPTLNEYQTNQGIEDVFVTKLSSSGSSLVYSTYLGGSSFEEGNGITVDAAGAAYVTGKTISSDFPTLNPYQTYQGGDDAFVTKLSSSGSSLVYSTYLGGSGYERGYAIAVDAAGVAYVTGNTTSSDFPTLNPYQTYQGDWDVFVTKLSSAGSSLVYSTYLGGSSADDGWGVAVDTAGAAYVTGRTFSSDFPTHNPYQTYQGGYDAFITKLSSSGSSLIYSTYLGGSNSDYDVGIAVDAAGAAYVTGFTKSADFPTLNPYQTDQGSHDAFVTKLSSSGSSLVYSTYLGGTGAEWGNGIAVDAAGAAYVTGYTQSNDFPTLNPYQGTFQGGVNDAFVTKFSSGGSSLVYSTYLGGSDNGDYGFGIAVDTAGAAYVTGYTYSSDFPTLNPYQTDQGSVDVFVTKLAMTCCNGDGIRGNVDNIIGPGGSVDVADLTYLVAYLFQGGPPPPCPEEGNADGLIGPAGPIDVADLTYLVAYLFQSGPAPAPCP